MAIWDEKVEELVVTESADSHKCLSCGGLVRFNTREGMLQCVSCGNRYYPESFELNELLSDRKELDVDSPEAKKREEEDPYKLERKPKHEIICNSCGATVITEVNTVSTFCAFCGSNAIVKGRLKKEFRPDFIVPFKLTKSEAIDKVKAWAKERHFVPSSFDTMSNYEKITGIYVPFWLVDTDCYMDIGGSGIKYVEDVPMYYDIRRKGIYKLKRVPFDGSRKINDKLMEAIEPFDYSEMVPFVDSYLEGMYAERYDLTPKDMVDRIANRFRDYMYDVGSEMLYFSGYKDVVADDDRSISKNYKCAYALLPVWLLSFNYNGITYRVAVNGQTGEVQGNVPESNFKRGLWKFGQYFKRLVWVYLAVILIFMLYGYAMFTTSETPMSFAVAGIYSLVGIIAVTILFYGVRRGVSFAGEDSPTADFIVRWIDSIDRKVNEMNSDINKVDAMPSIEEYLDRTYKTNIIKEDTPSMAGTVMATVKSSIQAENMKDFNPAMMRRRSRFRI